jgi:uncharacterized protein YqgV (UPF0045/DUF77 family)
VAWVIDLIDRCGLPYQLTPMGTIFEALKERLGRWVA